MIPGGDIPAFGRHRRGRRRAQSRQSQLPVAVAIERRERTGGADLVGRDRSIPIRVEGEDERIAPPPLASAATPFAFPPVAIACIIGNLYFLIRGWLERKRLGEVFLSPFDVVFTRHDVVEPDLLYLSHARAKEVLTAANVQGAPDLVIEIGSPSTRKRDETIKRRLYDHGGVSEYWVVDPELDVIRVYRREGEGFARAAELSAEAGDVLTTPLFNGLELRLADIFREPSSGQ